MALRVCCGFNYQSMLVIFYTLCIFIELKICGPAFHGNEVCDSVSSLFGSGNLTEKVNINQIVNTHIFLIY